MPQIYQNHFKIVNTFSQIWFDHQILSLKIEEINKGNNGKWTEQMNHFGDLLQQEFASMVLGSKELTGSAGPRISNQVVSNSITIDWVIQNKVSPIRNQGSCGSCYAFSTAAAVQSAMLQVNQIVILSTQQLVDCTNVQPYNSLGCDGGFTITSYQYIIDHGIAQESIYPYAAVNQACQQNTNKYFIKSYSNVAANCRDLENALLQKPVSVNLDASTWQFYKSGILSGSCSIINHSVLLVGSAKRSQKIKSYWKIKNSWGTNWGQSGYGQIASGNTFCICGMSNFYPTL